MDWAALEKDFGSYLEGDAASARHVFTELGRALRGYFHVRLGSGEDSEDLLQASLLKIHFARDRYDRRLSLKTWVFTIASRSLIDHWRGMASESEIFDPGPPGDGDTEPSGMDAPSDALSPEQKTLLHADLNAALARLKPIDRSIVYLYGVEGFSMAEIAQALSLTEGAAKLRAHRAYQELRKSL